MLHPGYTKVTPGFAKAEGTPGQQQGCAWVTPRLRLGYTRVTPGGYTTVTPQLHHGYTTVTPRLHQVYNNGGPFNDDVKDVDDDSSRVGTDGEHSM